MTWAPSPHAAPVGGPVIANVRKDGPQRIVIAATRVGRRPNLYSCKLECGHVSMTRPKRGMQAPRVVRCPDCAAMKGKTP